MLPTLYFPAVFGAWFALASLKEGESCALSGGRAAHVCVLLPGDPGTTDPCLSSLLPSVSLVPLLGKNYLPGLVNTLLFFFF